VAIGGVLSAFFAIVARRNRTLSRSGAIAGAAVATVSIAAGASWAALLFSFFVPASALSKLGESEKDVRVGSVKLTGMAEVFNL